MHTRKTLTGQKLNVLWQNQIIQLSRAARKKSRDLKVQKFKYDKNHLYKKVETILKFKIF